MTSSERVKYLRKELLHMTGEQFSVPLGVKKSAISQIENGINGLSDQMLKAICRSYNVSEEWLLTGDGKPFVPQNADQRIISFVNDALEGDKDDAKRKVLKHLAEMPQEGWEALNVLLDLWGI